MPAKTSAAVGMGTGVLLVLLFAVGTVRGQRRPDPFLPSGPSVPAAGDRAGTITEIDLVDAPVTTVFKMISEATGWTILLSPEVSKSPPKIDLWIKNEPPETILDRVCALGGLVVDCRGATVTAYEVALGLAPDEPEVMENLARTLIRSGREPERAEVLVRQALRAEFRPQWREWLLLQVSRFEQANRTGATVPGDTPATRPATLPDSWN